MNLPLNSEERSTAREAVEALASCEDTDDALDALERVGVTPRVFRCLDRYPGFWGYQGKPWHHLVRLLRNNQLEDVLARLGA